MWRWDCWVYWIVCKWIQTQFWKVRTLWKMWVQTKYSVLQKLFNLLSAGFTKKQNIFNVQTDQHCQFWGGNIYQFWIICLEGIFKKLGRGQEKTGKVLKCSKNNGNIPQVSRLNWNRFSYPQAKIMQDSPFCEKL